MDYLHYDNYKTIIYTDKYLAVFLPGHPNAFVDGYVYEHRLVASKMLGRYLKSEEVVHHKDKNKLNNSPDNLMVFATSADHTAYHAGTEAYEVNGVYYSSRKKYYCIDCGTEITQGATRCKKCLKEYKKANSPCPSREELKKLIRHNTFISIGDMFNVSDNTVRKWCIKYNLPFKSRTIKTISNEEWDLI